MTRTFPRVPLPPHGVKASSSLAPSAGAVNMIMARIGAFSHHRDIPATRPWPGFPSFPLSGLRGYHSFRHRRRNVFAVPAGGTKKRHRKGLLVLAASFSRAGKGREQPLPCVSHRKEPWFPERERTSFLTTRMSQLGQLEKSATTQRLVRFTP